MSKLSEAISGVFNSNIALFLQDSLSLLSYLGEIKEKLESIIGDEEKLRQHSLEYLWLNHLKKTIQKETDADALVNELLSGTFEIKGVKYPNIGMIKRLNKDLAQALQNYKSAKTKDSETLAVIQKIVSDAIKFAVNVDIMLIKVQELEEGDKKEEIKQKARLMHKLLAEIKFMEELIVDLESWGYKLMGGVRFFGKRVNLYISGGVSTDNKQFAGLEKFGDKAVIEAVKDNENVKSLLGQANAIDQIQYISALISFLKRDVDIKEGVWLQNVATKKFYENLEKHATAFDRSFSNKRYAELILQNKGLGEQPFAWINFLKKLKAEQEQTVILQQSALIERSKESLSSIFRDRQQYLRRLTEMLCNQTSDILRRFGGKVDILEAIKKGAKKIERALERLWIERRAKFTKFSGRIDVIAFNVKPEIGRILQQMDYKKDMDRIMERSKAFINFSKHKMELIRRVRNLDSNSLPHLFMLNFDLARMEELAKESQLVQSVIIEKTKSFKQYNIVPLRRAIERLMYMYSIMLEWLTYCMLLIGGINMQQTKSKLNQFRSSFRLGEQKIGQLQANAPFN